MISRHLFLRIIVLGDTVGLGVTLPFTLVAVDSRSSFASPLFAPSLKLRKAGVLAPATAAEALFDVCLAPLPSVLIDRPTVA